MPILKMHSLLLPFKVPCTSIISHAAMTSCLTKYYVKAWSISLVSVLEFYMLQYESVRTCACILLTEFHFGLFISSYLELYPLQSPFKI